MCVVGELDEFTLFSELEKSQGLVMIFFSGPDCASCHHLKKLLNSEYKEFLHHFSKTNTDFNIYEIKADKATALVNQFEVFHLPSMYLFKEGKFHCELHSEANSGKLIEAIELALSKESEEEP